MTAIERVASLVEEHRRALRQTASIEHERDESIRDAVREGASLRQVAAVAGMSHQRVAQIVAAPPT